MLSRFMISMCCCPMATCGGCRVARVADETGLQTRGVRAER